MDEEFYTVGLLFHFERTFNFFFLILHVKVVNITFEIDQKF